MGIVAVRVGTGPDKLRIAHMASLWRNYPKVYNAVANYNPSLTRGVTHPLLQGLSLGIRGLGALGQDDDSLDEGFLPTRVCLQQPPTRPAMHLPMMMPSIK